MFVKICGITSLEDARHAVASGASALGFVLWPRSPRYVTPEQVRTIVDLLPAGTQAIGVFVDEPPDAVRRAAEIGGLSAVQLNDASAPIAAGRIGVPVFKVVTLANAEAVMIEWPDVTLLLDAHDPVRRGGTGRTVDWDAAAAIARRRRLVLAGGLTPANVAEAIARVEPYGVDVCSGVEASPGIKDPAKVKEFVQRARH